MTEFSFTCSGDAPSEAGGELLLFELSYHQTQKLPQNSFKLKEKCSDMSILLEANISYAKRKTRKSVGILY